MALIAGPFSTVLRGHPEMFNPWKPRGDSGKGILKRMSRRFATNVWVLRVCDCQTGFICETQPPLGNVNLGFQTECLKYRSPSPPQPFPNPSPTPPQRLPNPAQPFPNPSPTPLQPAPYPTPPETKLQKPA